jgi:hypothetical protein
VKNQSILQEAKKEKKGQKFAETGKDIIEASQRATEFHTRDTCILIRKKEKQSYARRSVSNVT